MSIALICFWPAGKSDIRLRPNGGCIARKTSDGVKKNKWRKSLFSLYLWPRNKDAGKGDGSGQNVNDANGKVDIKKESSEKIFRNIKVATTPGSSLSTFTRHTR